MSSTNHKIRVIKREQRERRLWQDEEASGLEPQTGAEMPGARERESVPTVVEWVNEYRVRQHRSNEESYKPRSKADRIFKSDNAQVAAAQTKSG